MKHEREGLICGIEFASFINVLVARAKDIDYVERLMVAQISIKVNFENVVKF